MNLFLLAAIPLVLLFINQLNKPLSGVATLRSILGGLLTVVALFALYWPYSSGFRFPWNFFLLGIYQLSIEYLIFLVPLVLTWYFIGRRVSSEAQEEWFLTLWLGSGLALLGLRDALFTGPATQDLTLFLQPILRVVVLLTLPRGILGLLKSLSDLPSWAFAVGVPVGAAVLGLLNLWQLGWISYIIALPALPAAVWFLWKDQLFPQAK